MVVLVTCKNEEALLKNEGASLKSEHKIICQFSDTQWQITP